MQEVLPGIQDADGNGELEGGNDNVVDGLGHHDLPSSKGRNQGTVGGVKAGAKEGIVSTSKSTGQEGVGHGHILRDGGRIDAEEAEDGGDGSLCEADARRPNGDVVVLVAGHLRRIGVAQDDGHADLDDLLNDDIAEHFEARGSVALRNLGGCMQSVLREQVVHVDDVEYHGHDPVGDDRCYGG